MDSPNDNDKRTHEHEFIQKVKIFLFLDEEIDQFSWTSFISPFDSELWLGLLSFSFVTSMVLWIFHRFPKGYSSLSFLESIAISTSSIFGFGFTDANDVKATNSTRITMFVTFICGILFFYVYGSFLTSSLAVPTDYKPFNSPEEILNTNYR